MVRQPRPTISEASPAPSSEADERAQWARLYDENARFVAWFASRLLSRRDEVEDVVQEVFVIAARSLNQLGDPAQARGWLKTVSLRCAARKLRWKRVRTGFGLLPAETIDDTLMAPEASPEARVQLRQLLAQLDRMPTELRTAWALRYLHEEPLDTIADLCGCSLATVKRRIERAQRQVLEALRDD